MKITFSVNSLPPKKDGANSMWNKRTEIPRIRLLREIAAEAMGHSRPSSDPIGLQLVLHADPEDGDLDNFITGICDGLMAPHPNTPINIEDWENLSDAAQPHRAIVFQDDSQIARIDAERLPVHEGPKHYSVTIEGINSYPQ